MPPAKPSVHGIHHVTCIAGDPQENLDFYAGLLGLRLVKKSVNQDAPDTYHFFFADAEGTPGTDITFFPWPHLPPARTGVGLAIEIVLDVPPGSLAYWEERLRNAGVRLGDRKTRFGEVLLPFQDPHGLPLALVEVEGDRHFVPWDRSPVPSERQIRGVHSVKLCVERTFPTEALLTQRLGFHPVATDGDLQRFAAEAPVSGAFVDIEERHHTGRGRWGVGAIHHVAWRVRDDDELTAVREHVAKAGLHPTPTIDRFWFKSVYFREPGGVLFELATDGPGFAVDEDPDRLGEQLILPPWLEPERKKIEAQLRPVSPPGGAKA